MAIYLNTHKQLRPVAKVVTSECYDQFNMNFEPNSMRRVASVVDRARKFSLDADAHFENSNNLGDDAAELPAWGAIRQKVYSFIRSRSRSPGHKSPGSKSPGSKSPTGSKSPFNVSPNSRSPSKRSPVSKSPTRRSPSLRSPSTGSPARTPSCTPPLYSPSTSKPFVPASSRRTSFSKGSRESRSSSSDNDSLLPSQRRISSKPQRKGLSLNVGSMDTADILDGRPGTPLTGSPCAGTPITKGKTKFRNRLDGEVLDLQQMNDDLDFVEAARRPRKWSYHGTASPSAQVEAPKRHSFSTVSDHKTGIVVTNNDLASLLGQNQLLLPGMPICDVSPLPTITNPKARGRSQSIAVCAQSTKLFGKARPDEPVAPVVIRTTDCDHLPSIQSHDSVESQKEEEEENLLWDSSGSKVDVNLLGSVIETYLKTSTQEEDEAEQATTIEEEEVSEPEESTAGLLTPLKGLQVK